MPETTDTSEKCIDCGTSHYDHGKDHAVTSWARTTEGHKPLCFDCAHQRERKHFKKTGQMFAYVKTVPDQHPDLMFPRIEVTGWAGRVFCKARMGSRHNTYGFYGSIIPRRSIDGTIDLDGFHGLTFYGYHWPNAGDYCRLYLTAESKRRLATETTQ